MTNPRILIALSTFAQEGSAPLELLKKSGVVFEINATGKRLSKPEVLTMAQGFDGVVAGLEPYDAEVLATLSQLKCISRCGVGVDNVDLNVAKQKGVTVLNTPDVVVQPVAELTLGLIFDLSRKLTAHTELMRQGKWERLTGAQVAGKTVGVIGLGRIGRRVAQLLRRLDVDVLGYDIAPDPVWAKANNVVLVEREDLLSRADIVTLHVSSGPGHAFCLTAAELGRMKEGAMLINVARGSLVDEKSLVEALKSGHLAGAGLDVYAEEPYNGELCRLPNVVLTPHVGTLTRESRLIMEIEAVQNILKFFGKG